MFNLYCCVVQSLQQLEERRVGKVQEYIQKSADIENDAIPIINTCIAGIVTVAKTVSPAEVCSIAALRVLHRCIYIDVSLSFLVMTLLYVHLYLYNLPSVL